MTHICVTWARRLEYIRQSDALSISGKEAIETILAACYFTLMYQNTFGSPKFSLLNSVTKPDAMGRTLNQCPVMILI